ncbi:MAG: Bax inhibitor-1/YccA family protein [Planctomycetota bacterium]
MNSSNPVLRDSVFRGTSFDDAAVGATTSQMTVQGTMAKTAILLLAVTVAAVFTWQKAMAGVASGVGLSGTMPWMLGGLIGGLVLALVISFKPNLAPTLSVPYALLEGLFLGAVSAVYALQVGDAGGLGNSIVLQAVVLTFATAFAMLGLYSFRIIVVTDRMRSVVLAATGGIMLFYVIAVVMGFFGVEMPLIHSSGTLGILFSLVVVGIAAFNLLLDFDYIEKGAQYGASKKMEWFGAFALIVTLVWLYIEVLRLLAKLRASE